VSAQQASIRRPAPPDLTATPTLYTIGYAHLDTEWNWDYVATINQHLPKTLDSNFVKFQKYPGYVFNFSGANRYHMIKEYYPVAYAKLGQYIKAGRWFPAGSSMEEGDVNAPSAEAILRQILYGNDYFRREFGVTSAEYMLPDCFGFPWSLPSILAHAGIKGFSTQKLTWGSSVPDQPTTPYGEQGRGIPFNFGYWVGPDGKGVILAANPGSYSGRVTEDLSTPQALDRSPPRSVSPQSWMARLQENKQKLGLVADYHYYGTGDTGGSPTDSSVMWIQRAISHTDGAVKVLSAKADQFFLDIKPDQVARLPRYAGEMELTNHSAGSLTSQSYVKRWIRRNEQLADAAEKASIAAEWLGVRSYPLARLNEAWRLVMGSHFHDIAAGTAIPKAYEYAWNDQLLSLNQFADVLTDALSGVSASLDTRSEGTPVIVYNPLNISREDVVEATIALPGGAPAAVRVFGPDGSEVPSQTAPADSGRVKVLFLSRVPSVGLAVYDVRSGKTARASSLRVSTSALENERYRITVDRNGDIASILDKRLNRELLRAPMRLALQTESPAQWPAWNMDWDDASAAPRGYVRGPASVKIVESGPVRVALRIERSVDSSRFVQTIRLSAGDAGNRVEIANAIDWRTDSAALKATFPLTATNDSAMYNWDVGTMKRGTMYERKFEVPSHEWIDLTDRSGTYGVTILTDTKNGSDKTDASTLRLTLVYSPGISPGGRGYAVQRWQDWGHHDFVYGLSSHAGDFRNGQTDWQAWRLSRPLMAFVSVKHAGVLGKSFSLVRLNDRRVRLMALKKAEHGDEIIVRLVELDGRPHRNVRVTFAAPIVAAREVTGQEQPLGAATVTNGSLVTSLTPFAIRSFAVKLAASGRRSGAERFQSLSLPYDLSVASHDGTASAGGFDREGRAMPAELLPTTLPYGDITFELAPARGGVANAAVARGQSIALPPGSFDRLYLLAAADGDQRGEFRVGDRVSELTIQDWTGYIGQWDNRIFKIVPPTAEELARFAAQQARIDSSRRATIDSVRRAGGDTVTTLATLFGGRGGRGGQPRPTQVYNGLTPGFVKRAPVAWFASHRHTATGANEAYQYSYLFAYALDVPAGATTLTLPNNDRIRVLAATVAREADRVEPAQPLYDTLEPPSR
jgi:alpha-mannosidase